MQKFIGALCVLAGVQFFLVMICLESTVPGFDRMINYISDLGLGGTAFIFNSSLILIGLLSIVVGLLIFYFYKKRTLAIGLVLVGVSMALVGVFPENVYSIHVIVSFLTFLFGGIVAIISSLESKKPWKYVFAFLGLFSLGVLAIDSVLWYGFEIMLPVGQGLIERLIVYPFIFWAILFGVYLITIKNALIKKNFVKAQKLSKRKV